MRTLSRDEARAYYDQLGLEQDTQAYYEDPATHDMVAHAGFDQAHAVFEFGCGTGRFAERLLDRCLPADASYLGVDSSATMVDLARTRLMRFSVRAEVHLITGPPFVTVAGAAYDRVVSNYVLDLLSEADIRTVVEEAHRILKADGLLCLVSLAHGFTFLSRILAGAVSLVHAIQPTLVGGCRPVELTDFLPERDWHLRYCNKVAPYGIPSAILIAGKR